MKASYTTQVLLSITCTCLVLTFLFPWTLITAMEDMQSGPIYALSG